MGGEFAQRHKERKFLNDNENDNDNDNDNEDDNEDDNDDDNDDEDEIFLLKNLSIFVPFKKGISFSC